MKLLTLIFILFTLGCQSNPYKEFYKDYTGGVNPSTIPGFEVTNEKPQIEYVSNHDEKVRNMFEDGYMMVGSSSFSAPEISDSDAIFHAKKVSASRVLITKEYQSTRTGSIPMSTPTSQTTYGSFNGVYGNQNFSGTNQFTTYGTQTTYIPYSVDRYSYLASFWIKKTNQIFGVLFREKTDQERLLSNSNKGAAVDIVIKNSPAFNSDFFAGDLVVRIDESEILSPEHASELIGSNAGKKVVFKVNRNGKTISIPVELNKLDILPVEKRDAASIPEGP